MAILHRATIQPTKDELATAWLDARPWGGSGPVEMAGGYRFDDPDGEVGVEALLIRRGERLFQLPLTYRGAPLAGAEQHLITRMHHSVLGERWVYHAAGDPVAVDCFVRALRSEQDQAVSEIWDGDTLLRRVDPSVRVQVRETPDGSGANSDDLAVVPADGGELRLAHVLGANGGPAGDRQLVASWPDGTAVVAAFDGLDR